MKLSGLLLLTMMIVGCISCNNKVVPMQGSYMDQPYEFQAGSKEVAWNKIVDFLINKGLAIKTIDEHTGLITTELTSFLNSYTWENKDGSFSNPGALVVCNKVRGPFTLTTSLRPQTITGQWIIRIKEQNGKAIVVTKLANASGRVVIENTSAYGNSIGEIHNLTVQSTGQFEKSIEVALR